MSSNDAKLTVRVAKTRGGLVLYYWTTGLYGRLAVNDVRNPDLQAPYFTGSGSKAFWEAALAEVSADIQAGGGGGT